LQQSLPAEVQPQFQLVFGDLNQIAGSRNDLRYLVQALAQNPGSKPRLFQCCGDSDFLYEENQRFRNLAKSLSLELTYEEGPGDHNWAYWDQQIERALDWMSLRSLNQ
jgi:putative tributyrin esterase